MSCYFFAKNEDNDVWPFLSFFFGAGFGFGKPLGFGAAGLALGALISIFVAALSSLTQTCCVQK